MALNRREWLKWVATGALAIAIGGGLWWVYSRGKEAKKRESIKIGHLADLSGALALYGYSHDKVLKAAIEVINERGGINGYPVEYIVEDTATKQNEALIKLRRLIEYHKVDFIIGSQHSGINIASNPIIKEYKIIHFPVGEATSITAEKGNRYVFRINNNVREQVRAGVEWVIENLGKKWVTVVVDYAWGHSNEEEFKRYAEGLGAKVIKSLRVPLGTQDFLPYLKGIPSEAEAVFYAFFGTDFINFIKTLYNLRPDLERYAPICAIEGIDPIELGEAIEGSWFLTWFPRRLEGLNTHYNREFRRRVGVDEEGRDKSGKLLTISHSWALWEIMFALKEAIEKVDWSGPSDTPELIRALEGMKMRESFEHPQGDKFIRAEDHQAFMRHWIEKVEDGKLKVVKSIPLDTSVYEPTVDYTSQAL